MGADRVRFGGYFHPFPLRGNISTIERAERLLRRPIDVVMWYQQWGAPFGVKNFHPRWCTRLGRRLPVIKWEPRRLTRNPHDQTFATPDIAAGAHDGYLRRWADAIAQLDRPLVLCPLPEPNGAWFPWSRPGGSTVSAYVDAWHRIRAVFAEAGATGVQWLWNVNADDVPADNRLEDYYPGPEAVDLLGLSVYNWGTARPWSRWREFAEVLGPAHRRITALGGQPIWIAEVGCTPAGGDKPRWIRTMWNDLPGFDRIDTLLWFNMNKETDWRATVVPDAFGPPV